MTDIFLLRCPFIGDCVVLKARVERSLLALGVSSRHSAEFPVAIARGKHLFPFRTEPLSPSAPMVLGPQGPGRVGRRRFLLHSSGLVSVSDGACCRSRGEGVCVGCGEGRAPRAPAHCRLSLPWASDAGGARRGPPRLREPVSANRRERRSSTGGRPSGRAFPEWERGDTAR